MAESGGEPRTVVKADAALRPVQPQLLDEGRRVLFTAIAPNAATDEGQIVVQSLDGSSRTEVIKAGVNGHALPSGHLLYVQKGTLFAAPFDLRRAAVTGPALAVVEGVAEVSGTWSGQFSVSSSGSLVYRPGVYSGRSRSLSIVDRGGTEKASGMPFRDHAMPRLSPDGTRVVVSAGDGESDIWVWDVAKGTYSRLTFGPAVDAFAIWMPDSKRVIFRSTEAGRTDIFRRNADGTGAVEALTKNGTGGDPEVVSPDGKYLVYRTGDPVTGDANLHLLPLDGLGQSRPLLADPNYDEFGAAVSPDGRWIAYQSNESSRSEVYVRPFPDVDGGKWMVSVDGGTQTIWSRSGRELFYVAYPRIFGVPVARGAAFAHDKPQLVLDNMEYSFGPYSFGTTTAYDVADDGRFLVMRAEGVGNENSRTLVVITNWFDELRAKLAATK